MSKFQKQKYIFPTYLTLTPNTTTKNTTDEKRLLDGFNDVANFKEVHKGEVEFLKIGEWLEV